jgi:metal-responsive CopG/Arc/MetJ family transcriptional regulator
MEPEPTSERMSVALPRSVMDRIDAWRSAMDVVPARSTAVRVLLERALADLEQDKGRKRRP